MDDFVVNVRQIAQYPQATAAGASDAILLQSGGLGGPYQWATPQGLLASLSGQQNPADADTATLIARTISATLTGAFGFNLYRTASGPFAQINPAGMAAMWDMPANSGPRLSLAAPTPPGTSISLVPVFNFEADGSLTTQQVRVARDPRTPDELVSEAFMVANTVASWNGRTGDVFMSLIDIEQAGGAPIQNPAFSGRPTVPNIDDYCQSDAQIANTKFVRDSIVASITDLLMRQAFVFTFNGRAGQVTLKTADVNAAYYTKDGDVPKAPTPPMSDYSDRIATTRWMTWVIDDFYWTINQLENGVSDKIELANYATLQYVADNFAPINDAVLTGMPSAPTAAPGTNTGQLATTAFVHAAVIASTSGVVSFNTRTGAVVLTLADVTNAGGAPLTSPTFNGVPTAPNAPIGTNSNQVATCAWVMQEINAISAGVISFNGRDGDVSLLLSDVTGVGGAPLASPTFTGTPAAPTATPGNATTQIATTAFVTAAVSAASGVASFNGRTGAVTLSSNDISAVGGALLVSPALTGAPTAPTAAAATNTTQIATTAFVQAALAATGVVNTFNGRAGAVTLTLADITGAGGAPLNSPGFTGAPTAPTPAAGDNSQRVATTAFLAGGIFPSGTTMPFYQAAAPVGWTQVTTHNDKLLRVVSGAGGGSGGSNSFSSVNAQTVVGSHTLALAELPTLSSATTSWMFPVTTSAGQNIATVQVSAGSGYFIPYCTNNQAWTYGLNYATGQGAHNHTINMNIQYCDLIIASKN